MATLAREKLGPLARRGAPPSRLGAPGKGRFLLIAGPFIAGAAVMGCGVWLRGWTFDYHGIANQTAFNHAAFAHMGGYTDIASLFFRNRMWLHRLPYVHYAFEYPVGTGLFAWLTSLVGAGVGTYLAVNAIVLGAFGLLTIWLLRRFEGANPWLLALSPALALYVVLNWDLVSIASLVVALVLFDRRRDAWGAVALGVATWTKFFPIIVLPVVLCARLLEGRDWRERARAWAWILIPFAAVTVAFNAPFIYRHGVHGGLVVSSSWFYFFHFNATRGAGGGLWNLFQLSGVSRSTVNDASAALTLAGLVVILGALVWAVRRGARPSQLVRLALLGCVAWFFFASKTYSPQYGLWVMALLALTGAPVAWPWRSPPPTLRSSSQPSACCGSRGVATRGSSTTSTRPRSRPGKRHCSRSLPGLRGRSSRGSRDHDRGSFKPTGAQIRQGFLGPLQLVQRHSRLDRDARRQLEQLVAIFPGQVGHRADRSLLP